MPELQTLCQSCAITFANAKDFFSVSALSSFYFKRIKNTTFYDQGSVWNWKENPINAERGHVDLMLTDGSACH